MTSGNFDGDSLKVYFDRIVNLERDKRAEAANFAADIKAVYAEAKESGFSTSILRGIVAEQLKPQPSQEDLDLRQIYKEALGLTPIEQHIAESGEEGGGEQVDGETGEITDTEDPDMAETPQARKGGDPIPDGLALARKVVRQASANKLDVKPAKVDGSVVTVKKSDTAKGSVSKAMWAADDALIRAGFTRAGGNDYAVPAAEG